MNGRHLLRTAALLMLVGGCHQQLRSRELRGPGPGHSPAVGYASNRETAMPAGANHPTNWGYGSAYDPHIPGSRAQTGLPSETAAFPPWWLAFPTNKKPGVPPAIYDPKPEAR